MPAKRKTEMPPIESRVEEPKVEEPKVEEVAKVKSKRVLPPALVERSVFNKANYDKSRHLPVRERFGFLSKLFMEHKQARHV